jgi:hypothetical protein
MMQRDVVPEDQVTHLPPMLVHVVVVVENVEEIAQERIALSRRNADDMVGLELVGEDDLGSGARMMADDGLGASRRSRIDFIDRHRLVVGTMEVVCVQHLASLQTPPEILRG